MKIKSRQILFIATIIILYFGSVYRYDSSNTAELLHFVGKNEALVAPRFNNLYNQKSKHIVDNLILIARKKIIGIIVGAFALLAQVHCRHGRTQGLIAPKLPAY